MAESISFKLIALRTGKRKLYTHVNINGLEIQIDPLKVLKEDTIYSLRNEYSFPEGDFSSIFYHPGKDIELFNLGKNHNYKSINISAIVGENGSGKSTLIDLLYFVAYNIGGRVKILSDTEGDLKNPLPFLDIQLLYATKIGELICLTFNEKNIIKQYFKLDKLEFKQNGERKVVQGIDDIKDFFYSIVVNYSHYALNSEEIGDWVHSLFHKNDGYQTPIVLNPMRKEGNIDINKENHLLKRRLIANLLEVVENEKEHESLRNLSNGKIAERIELTYNPAYYPYLQHPIEPAIRTKLTDAISASFRIDLDKIGLNEFFLDVILNYIHQKLIKMSNYKGFRSYGIREGTKDAHAIKGINSFINKVRDSNSHIAFKLKGTILFAKYFTSIFGDNILSTGKFEISIKDYSKKIIEIRNKEEDLYINTFMLAPPSFYHTDIILSDNVRLSSLSSGEKQKIHSISSIVYHLINLNSVEEQSKVSKDEKLVHYKYVNIVLDEIELYYHPEWQRTYIYDLIDYINKSASSNIDNIQGVNIIFLTHSPYILSDIPHSSVLRLFQGVPIDYNNHEMTFGSNIHDLLTNDFFMKNGFMGKYAKSRIEEAIRVLNIEINKGEIEALKKKESKGNNARLRLLEAENEELKKYEYRGDLSYYEKVINIIGEPVIRNKIKSMYSMILGDKERKQFVTKQIEQIAKDAGLNIKIE